ncbi:MAG TPA: hypothetical protein VFS67_34950 [Polyangiaceae bacterium]|nr:hypothetical protein [Polyangiaceae bacterium]
MASVEVRELSRGGELRDFLGVVEQIYRDDPKYVRPLDFEVKSRISRSSPFFEHAEAAFFVAYRNGQCVGRCSAQIDHEHLRRHKDDTGFFGFLDTVEDAEVAKTLLDAARRWLSDRGMKRIRGPFSLSINDETGCLVEGFDTPPMVMMPHHRSYQGELIERAGFARHKDLYAWRYQTGDVPPRVQKAHDEIEALPEVYSRPVDPRQLERDTRVVMDVFNDAWGDNWSFVPYTEHELAKLAKDLKLILDPSITRIAYVRGEPAAVALALPNLNEAIGDLEGRLFPTGAAKLLYRVKVKGIHSARLALLGIRKKFRADRKYAGLSLYLYCKLNESGRRNGYTWGELSWTDEANGPVNAGIRVMGGKIYKKYRVYESALA